MIPTQTAGGGGVIRGELSGPGTGGDVSRIMRLAKARQKEIEDFERRKKAIEEENKIKGILLDEKFTSHRSSVEEKLKLNTIGLKTQEEFQRTRENLEKAEAERLLKEEREKEAALERKRSARDPGPAMKKLSFSFDEEGGGEEQESDSTPPNSPPTGPSSPPPGSPPPSTSSPGAVAATSTEEDRSKRPRRGLGKDPSVNTEFLPDREREMQECAERVRLAELYKQQQAKIKAEKIDVTWSYWDGSGHRRTTTVEKGCTIGQFLALAQREFRELQGCSAHDLLFVKEDCIIPHHYSFYDLIVSKARGKSGPLWNWDVHEDVRLVSDAKVEKDESHAAKVLERRYYEQNQHIFPMNRWSDGDVYDPSHVYDRFTIRDTMKPTPGAPR